MAERFEELFAVLLEKMGYIDVRRVGKVGDRGVDVLAFREDEFGHRWKYIVQCKFYEEGLVSSPEMQQFIGAINIHNADRGIYVTSSSFTAEAIDIAKNNEVTLIDKKLLEELFIKHDIYERPSRKKRKKKKKSIEKPMNSKQLYDLLDFGGKTAQEFIIPNIKPTAVLDGLNIVLINNLMINLEEINFIRAFIKTRGLFVVNWSVKKVWHDSQGRVRKKWSGNGVYATDERGNVIHDIGKGRKEIKSYLSELIRERAYSKWEELCEKFEVKFPKVKRIAYKRLINIQGIPKQDIHCESRKLYIAHEITLEYKYRGKTCIFSVDCIKGNVTHKTSKLSKAEARREAVRLNPQLEFMSLTISEKDDRWIFSTKEDPNLNIQIHKYSGKILTGKTPSENIIHKALKKAKEIFEDSEYDGNIFLNVSIGKTCSVSWEMDFTSKKGNINIQSDLIGKFIVKKNINKRYALELAKYNSPTPAKLLDTRVTKLGYKFHFVNSIFDWEIFVDNNENVKTTRKNLVWEAAFKRAKQKLTNEGIVNAELKTSPKKQTQESYSLEFQSQLDGVFKIQVTYSIKENYCTFLEQKITEHRAIYLAEKHSSGKVISIKKRFFGLGDSWNITID